MRGMRIPLNAANRISTLSGYPSNDVSGRVQIDNGNAVLSTTHTDSYLYTQWFLQRSINNVVIGQHVFYIQ